MNVAEHRNQLQSIVSQWAMKNNLYCYCAMSTQSMKSTQTLCINILWERKTYPCDNHPELQPVPSLQRAFPISCPQSCRTAVCSSPAVFLLPSHSPHQGMHCQKAQHSGRASCSACSSSVGCCEPRKQDKVTSNLQIVPSWVDSLAREHVKFS